jgi:outer membrane protein assembly factor BamB
MRWLVDPGLGYMDLSPFSNGEIVVVATDRYVAGLRFADGKKVWQQQLPQHVIDLTTTHWGPVTIYDQSEQTFMTAFNWDGTLRWRIPAGHGMGTHSLRGLEYQLLALGMPLVPGARLCCRLIDADHGTILAEYPNEGDVPDVVARGLLTSVRSTDTNLSGLFLYDVAEQQVIRLLEESNSVRAVAGSIAVVDTHDIGLLQSQLIAVDIDSGQRLWVTDGGPNMTLAADGRQVACVTTLTPTHFTATLRDLFTGEPAWQSGKFKGRYANVLLTEEAVLVFIDGARMQVIDRKTGTAVQDLDEPSTAVYGACLTSGTLIDVCNYEVRCFGEVSA